MRLDVKALAMTAAVLWGGTVLLAGLANMVWNEYALEFLQMVASIYPGYHAMPSLGDVLVATVYGILDGAVGGVLFGFIYNCMANGGGEEVAN